MQYHYHTHSSTPHKRNDGRWGMATGTSCCAFSLYNAYFGIPRRPNSIDELNTLILPAVPGQSTCEHVTSSQIACTSDTIRIRIVLALCRIPLGRVKNTMRWAQICWKHTKAMRAQRQLNVKPRTRLSATKYYTNTNYYYRPLPPTASKAEKKLV